MNLTLIGAGMGNPGQMTREAHETLARADVVLGAPRLVDKLAKDCAAEKLPLALPDKIAAAVLAHPKWKNVCVLLSGDVGFYSGARQLLELLADYRPTLIPGVSAPQYLAARLGRPWQDFHLVSAHGVQCDVLAEVMNHPAVFFLTGGGTTPTDIVATLCTAGLDRAVVTVAENLSSRNERIVSAPAAQFADQNFAPLSVVLVENSETFTRSTRTPGIPDAEFIRGKTPMTKREVRAVALSLLSLREDDIVYDIGAGTGSVAIEACLTARRGRVYAIEDNAEALELIAENQKKFGVHNLFPIPGAAPAAFTPLPPPAAAFVGGSRGALGTIIPELLGKNPDVRIVLAAIALETLSTALDTLQRNCVRNIETVQIAASRVVRRGDHSMLEAQNPVFLVSGGGL